MRFKGSFVALATPFRHGAVDEPALRKLVKMHLRSGTSGIVPCATTGEAPCLEPEEWARILSLVVEEATGKLKVIAYTGTNDTRKTAVRTEHAEALGADAALVVTPYYNKPTQEGLYEHFKAVAGASRLPVILYNVPSRTGVNLEPRTVARLAGIASIVGVKEASGNLDQVSQIVRLCGPGFSVLSGDDSLTLPMMAVGASGVISVVANILPGDTARLVAAFLAGDTARARKLHLKMFPLMKALFMETSPGPLKTAMEMLGLCFGELRLPLVRPGEAVRKAMAEALKGYGLKIKGLGC
jgi:4-hydroxy-tetrahydrodipicolinate synthase